jgi:PKD repeat protein
MNDFTIKIAGTTNTNMSGGYLPSANFTTVLTTNSAAAAGWNTHTFTTQYVWNGTDNLVFEACFHNSSWTSNTNVTYDITPFVSIFDGFADNASASGCTDGVVFGSASSNRPRMRINATTTACSNLRLPVSFALNPSVAVADFTFNIAADGATVTFNSAGSNGNIYVWDFGDLSPTSSLTNPTHVYQNGNTYTVCLLTIDTVCNTTDTICKTVVATVGIEEGLLGQSLSIYPNPNTGNFRVSFMVEGVKKANINVVNPMGQVVYTHTPGNISGEFKHDIDLGRMAAGVYIVQITTDDGIISRRVTVQK